MIPQRTRWANDFVYGGITLIVGRYDGTVTLHSFACELGNGSHTRVAQIVAESLGISFDMVSIRSTSTDALGNCTETGGRFTSLTAMRLAKKEKSQKGQIFIG